MGLILHALDLFWITVWIRASLLGKIPKTTVVPELLFIIVTSNDVR